MLIEAYVADRITRWRIYRQLSKQDLARKAGIGKSTLAKIEQGSVMAHIDTLQKIAEALEIAVSDLVPSRDLTELSEAV